MIENKYSGFILSYTDGSKSKVSCTFMSPAFIIEATFSLRHESSISSAGALAISEAVKIVNIHKSNSQMPYCHR